MADSGENHKESAQGSKCKKDCSGENAGARTTATEEKEVEIQQGNRPENAEGPEDRDNAARTTATEEKEVEIQQENRPENAEGPEDGDNAARTTATEEKEVEIQQGNRPENAEGPEDRDNAARATGNEEKEEQQEGNGEAGVGMIETGVGMIEAGDGPLQLSDEDKPCSGNVESLADGFAAIKVADGCQNGTSCEQESCQALDTSKEAVVEGASDSVALFPGESGKNATEQVGSTSQHLDIQTEESAQAASKEASITLLGENTTAQKFQVDSLRVCLKKFCSPELLTGNNKFACTFCTKKKEVAKNEAQHHMSTSSEVKTTAEDVVEVSIEDKEEGKSLSQPTESQHSLVIPPDSSDERESEETGSAAHKHSEEATSEVPDNQLEKNNEERTDAGGGEVFNSDESCQESSHEESVKESDGKNFVLYNYYTTVHAYFLFFTR